MAPDLMVWEAAGVAFIIVVGNILHFAFAWSGRNTLVGIIAPVNESVWEHLKMAYWPAAAYAGVQLAVMDPVPANFLMAKAIGVYTMGAVMLGLYYLTEAMPWQPSTAARLAADGLTFVAAVGTGQFVGCALIQLAPGAMGGAAAGVAALAAPAVLLCVTTFSPPRTAMFADQMNGTFGIRRRT